MTKIEIEIIESKARVQVTGEIPIARVTELIKIFITHVGPVESLKAGPGILNPVGPGEIVTVGPAALKAVPGEVAPDKPAQPDKRRGIRDDICNAAYARRDRIYNYIVTHPSAHTDDIGNDLDIVGDALTKDIKALIVAGRLIKSKDLRYTAVKSRPVEIPSVRPAAVTKPSVKPAVDDDEGELQLKCDSCRHEFLISVMAEEYADHLLSRQCPACNESI